MSTDKQKLPALNQGADKAAWKAQPDAFEVTPVDLEAICDQVEAEAPKLSPQAFIDALRDLHNAAQTELPRKTLVLAMQAVLLAKVHGTIWPARRLIDCFANNKLYQPVVIRDWLLRRGCFIKNEEGKLAIDSRGLKRMRDVAERDPKTFHAEMASDPIKKSKPVRKAKDGDTSWSLLAEARGWVDRMKKKQLFTQQEEILDAMLADLARFETRLKAPSDTARDYDAASAPRETVLTGTGSGDASAANGASA